ncbi:carboxypeptidase-like regulatory domain-containing protein [Polyangium mundeleinium]|uniref:Carboxypeptidase-like regulatory domain-containing protein n=1 Tax=Polyangium mundeleinium TaxID=2995306 RepID=A0ABT5EYT7_9BACT|nr:carboxypeptidase-like regulatory domain-containing protein [Polyangium mundeleinium]MDC0746998.1 carboxypeptidase-like regulatory domain-containing protein [Polyangium mundeleinium]
MHLPTNQKKPFFRSPAGWATLGTVPVLALGAFFLWPSASPSHAADAQDASVPDARAKYVNRGLFPSDEPGDEQARTITGKVYSIDGQPLAGVQVSATSFAIAGNLPTTVASLETDADGRFEMRLADGTYQLVANKSGYGPSFVPAQTGESVSLVLTKSGTVRGRVLDADRAPMQRFVIDVLTAAPDSFAAPMPLFSKRFEGTDGTFEVSEFPAWPVVIRATAVDHAPAFSNAIHLEKPGDTREVELLLGDGCVLEGTVKDGSGRPLADVFVDAEARFPGGVSEVSMEAASRTESDGEGRFRLEHAPSGKVVLRGYDSEHAPSTVVVEVAADCKPSKSLDLVMSDGGSISGVARKSDGSPLPGARLTLMQRAVGFVNVIADEEGQFRFDSIPPGNTRLELVYGNQRTSAAVRVEEGAVTERDITVHPTGQGEIRGRITAGGAPLAGVQVLVATNRGREQGLDVRFPVTDKDGVYKLAGLPGGHYAVNVVTSAKTEGVQVEEGQVAVLDLDIAEPPKTGARAEAE